MGLYAFEVHSEKLTALFTIVHQEILRRIKSYWNIHLSFMVHCYWLESSFDWDCKIRPLCLLAAYQEVALVLVSTWLFQRVTMIHIKCIGTCQNYVSVNMLWWRSRTLHNMCRGLRHLPPPPHPLMRGGSNIVTELSSQWRVDISQWLAVRWLVTSCLWLSC